MGSSAKPGAVQKYLYKGTVNKELKLSVSQVYLGGDFFISGKTSYKIINLYEIDNMQEKLTILISSEHKTFIKRHARRQNKSVSKFIDDLLSTIKRQASSEVPKDAWIEKTAGAYSTGKKDILKELFKGISR